MHGVRRFSLFRAVYRSDLGKLAALSLASSPATTISQTDSLSLPPLLPFLLRHTDAMTTTTTCIKQRSVVACHSQTLLPSPIAWGRVCFVALPLNLRRVPDAAF